MVYMVTYDLNNPGQNYDDVINAIKESSTKCISCWKSSYLIKSNYLSANDIQAKIEPYLDSNDSLLVIEVVNNKQGWLSKEQWNYINNSIFG